MISPLRSPLTLATAQFPVTGDIQRNGRWIRRQIAVAAEQGADAILFPETALSGYAGIDFPSFTDFDWETHGEEFESIRHAAREHSIWALVGSAHFVNKSVAPLNSVYAIDPRGQIRTRYDKTMLYRKERDHFSAGSSLVTFRIGSTVCGILICFDSCFPELYAELERRRVRVLFHAYYNAGNRGPTAVDDLLIPQARTRAYDASYFIVGSNSSRKRSAAPSFIAGPDGRLSSLTRHQPGVLVETIAADDPFWEFRRSASTSIRGARRAQKSAPTHSRIENRKSAPSEG